LLACSNANNRAPVPGKSHPARYLLDHAADANADLASCRSCHQADLKGSASATSCFTCHQEDKGNGGDSDFAIHSLPYADPDQHGRAARNAQADCLACHGTAPNRFDGGILADDALYGVTAPTCNSAACHPAAGAHQGYPGVTDNCTVCHSGAGSNSDNHFDTTAPATIRMLTTYNSQGNTAGFDTASGTCSNIRCHGGRTTPNWSSGSINLATDCEACHTYGTGEYNSYRSGGHGEHRGLSCTRCHDAAILVNPNGARLSNLATTAFEQDALATVLPLGQSCQQSGCHGGGIDFGEWWDDD
jgi:predicted CxxxxCH...CXXCH cytochrome family protein